MKPLKDGPNLSRGIKPNKYTVWRSGPTDVGKVFKNGYSCYNNLFVEHNTPVFIIRPKEITINPSLKEVRFMTVKDVYTTFQEIQMFISGVLGTGTKETVDITDDVKRDKHGFDNKSFKKEPSEKKRKRR